MFKFTAIGKVLKPFKNKGEFLAIINPEIFSDLLNCPAIFLQIDGIEVPFFIENLDLNKEASLIKVEEFNAPEDVKPYNGEDIYLRTTDITIDLDPQDNLSTIQLNGHRISDKTSGNEFIIQSTVQYPQQLMAVILVEDKEVLIPLAEDWIIQIDLDRKLIEMNLPEGLIDL